MRRIGQLHAITDVTRQSASPMASWLGFYEKRAQRLPIISIDCFGQAAGGSRRRTSKHHAVQLGSTVIYSSL